MVNFNMANPLIYNEKNPLSFQLAENFGNRWLKQKILSHPDQYPGENTNPDYLSFAYVDLTCKEKFTEDLACIFLERKLSAKEIEAMSVSQLLNLASEDFFAIVDLISGEQAVEIIKSETNLYRKVALYYFNSSFAETFALQQKQAYEKLIDKSVQELAQEAFLGYKKFSAEDLQGLKNSEAYRKLNQERMKLSKALVLNQEKAQDLWQKVNNDFIIHGIQGCVTDEFLQNLNHNLRIRGIGCCSPEKCGLYRKVRQEASIISENLYYLPGQAVESEMKSFIDWLNLELKQGDLGESNPIIIAATAYQRFISTRPFLKGNGRTGRMLADLILRRYQLLPAAWKEAKLAIFPCKKDAEVQFSPDMAIQKLIEGLNVSYKIMESSVVGLTPSSE